MTSPSLQNLQQSLGRLTAGLNALRTAPVARELTDETGQITVTVDDRGRIESVRIGAQWREHIEPSLLGATILSVPTQASLRRLGEALEGFNDAVGQPVVEVPAARYEFPPSVAGEVAELILDVDRRTKEFQSLPESERYVEVEPDDESQPRSSNGMVVADISSGTLRNLRFDEGWLERAGLQAISDSATEALQAGYAALDEGGATDQSSARLSPAGRELRGRAAELTQLLETYRRNS